MYWGGGVKTYASWRHIIISLNFVWIKHLVHADTRNILMIQSDILKLHSSRVPTWMILCMFSEAQWALDSHNLSPSGMHEFLRGSSECRLLCAHDAACWQNITSTHADAQPRSAMWPTTWSTAAARRSPSSNRLRATCRLVLRTLQLLSKARHRHVVHPGTKTLCIAVQWCTGECKNFHTLTLPYLNPAETFKATKISFLSNKKWPKMFGRMQRYKFNTKILY